MSLIIKLILTLILSLFTVNNVAHSKIEIVLSVNEEIVTNFDIEKEAQYLKLLNPQLNELNDNRIYELSKTSLINEIIKKKEISKFNISKNKDDQFIDEQFNQLFKKLNYKNRELFIEELKKKKTYTIDEIKEKINIELKWNELIFLRFNTQVKINNDLIKKKIKSIKDHQQKSFFLSEIVFDLKKKENYSDKLEIIQSSISEIGFRNSATIYSLSDSSKYGGEIGWVSENNLTTMMNEKLNKLKIGEITRPIKIGKNFIILKIEDIKIEKISIDTEKETKKLINSERNKQLNQFSRIYFDKLKINYLINEK